MREGIGPRKKLCEKGGRRSVRIRDNPLSQGALKRLVSAYIGRNVELIAVTANEPPGTDFRDRQIRYDISVKLDGGEPANVEMTLNPRNFEALRLEYYTARLFAAQNIKGTWKDYGDLLHTWHISLIGSRTLFPDRWGIHQFEYYDPKQGTAFGGRTHIIVVELEKAGLFEGKAPKALSDAEKWALFFRYVKDKGKRGLVNELLRKEEGIAMAGEVLLTISRDEAEWARLESEYKYEVDRQSFIVGAHREGLAKGLVRGEAKAAQRSHLEKLESARKMKQDGLSVEKIHKYTRLSPGEIEML
ncbi:MAG: PD-(D/E)XK nuclease family transposase [Treponema sp.]|nr:PD-(D/E)XK nuclease family transposase [Treponema sp.]